MTVRRLSDEVNHVLAARDALSPSVALDPPPDDGVLVSPVPTLVAAAPLRPNGGRSLPFEEARMQSRASGAQIGAHPLPAPTDERSSADSGATKSAARAAPDGDTIRRTHAEVCDAAVSFTGPASVVALLRDVLDAFAVQGTPRWVAFERVLLHVITYWESAPRHRDPIFARDGWRCAVPACSSRRNLHDHHLLYRGRGGGNEHANRVAVCAAHHLHGLHRGVIRAWGSAPTDVRWQLGVRWNAPPLLTYVGDRLDVPPSLAALSG